DDAGALARRRARPEAEVVHGDENPPLRRLEPVADVRQRPADDDRLGVGEVALAQFVYDVEGVDRLAVGQCGGVGRLVGWGGGVASANGFLGSGVSGPRRAGRRAGIRPNPARPLPGSRRTTLFYEDEAPRTSAVGPSVESSPCSETDALIGLPATRSGSGR